MLIYRKMVSGCWCPCVPSLARRNTTSSSSTQPQQQQHQPEYYNHQPAAVVNNGSSSSAAARAGINNNKRRGGGGVGRPFSISAATERADMVQMFYYENRGKCCRKLLRYNGYPNKVLLFPEEGWARSASSSYWTLTPFWWSRSRCKVVEVAGTRRYSTQAKMVDTGTGTLYIIGSFKRQTIDADFKLFLTSNVSSSDFNMGYSMTGTLERGCKKTNTFQMTHFAVIRRRDYEKAYEDPSPT